MTKYHYENLVINGKKVDISKFNYKKELPQINIDLIADIIVHNYTSFIDEFDLEDFNVYYSHMKNYYIKYQNTNIDEINISEVYGRYLMNRIPDCQPVEEAIMEAINEVYNDINLINFIDYILYNCDKYDIFYEYLDGIDKAIIEKFGNKVMEKLHNK